MQSTSCEMPGWMKYNLESRLPGKISITSNMEMTPPLWQKTEEPKSLLMKVKEESEKFGLNLNIQYTKVRTSSPITSWQIDGKQWKQWQAFYSWAPKSLQMVKCSHEIKTCLFLGRKAMTNESRDIADKGLSTQSYGFSNSHVWMWELDHKRGWALKNWCFQTVVLEKTLESPLNCKQIQAVHPQRN